MLLFIINVEDITFVVISYEIYVMSLWRVSIPYEITTNVRFCLSYDPLKWDFITFKINIVLIRKGFVAGTLSMMLHLHTKELYKCDHTIFMT